MGYPVMSAYDIRRLPSKNGLLDWDCAEAIDVVAMADALAYIRQHAEFPVCPPWTAAPDDGSE